MIRKNKLSNKKENENNININTSTNHETLTLMLKELMELNKTISKVLFTIKDHEKRISKLENGGRG